ncbi:MAG: hypothetical protein ACFFDP_08830, partial [Promethearchaeota archaeon]
IMGSIPLFVVPKEAPIFTMILPGSNAAIQVFMLFVIYPLAILAGGIIFGYITTPLYLTFHKYILGRKMTYGIYQRPPLEMEKFGKLGSGFFPGLVAINIASMLSPYLSSLLLFPSVQENQTTFFGFIILLIFTSAFSSILFSGVWFLNDAGIGYSNKNTAMETDGILEIRSCGGWYKQLLKGYAGIGAIFTYIVLITNFWFTMETGWMDPITMILILSIFVPIPIYAAMAVLPTIILLEVTKAHRIKYVLKVARKMGITEDMTNLV